MTMISPTRANQLMIHSFIHSANIMRRRDEDCYLLSIPHTPTPGTSTRKD